MTSGDQRSIDERDGIEAMEDGGVSVVGRDGYSDRGVVRIAAAVGHGAEVEDGSDVLDDGDRRDYFPCPGVDRERRTVGADENEGDGAADAGTLWLLLLLQVTGIDIDDILADGSTGIDAPVVGTVREYDLTFRRRQRKQCFEFHRNLIN